MIINGVNMPNFKASEFSEDPEENAHPHLLERLQKYRTILGKPVIPSQTPGALARFDDDSAGSMHYAVCRYSKAIDVFPDCDIFEAFIVAVRSGLFYGIGVYFDTHINGEYKPMLHLDLRPSLLMWYKYDSSPDFYSKLLSEFNLHKIYDREINRSR
jgi:hypothetical protein